VTQGRRRQAYEPRVLKNELRDCLRCGEPFMSSGKNNRLCRTCIRFAEDGNLGGLPDSVLRCMPFDGIRKTCRNG